MRSILIFLLLFATSISAKPTLNVFTWSNFVPPFVIQQFEKETGIIVNVSTYDNNEVLYAKLKASTDSGYDVVFPSSYYVEKMIREHMLLKLDKNALPNMKHLDRRFIKLPYDENNDYNLPYLWSSTGIVVNKKYIDPRQVQYWSDLWKPEFKNKLLVLNERRDVFSAVMLTLKYPLNDKNKTHIELAYKKLRMLLPNIRLFNSIAITNILIDEDIYIAMSWSGEAAMAQEENPNLVYIYPKDGFPIGLDCVAIPKNSANQKNAHKFINFLLRPEIGKEIVIATHYGTPNKSTLKHLPKKFSNNLTINPSEQTFKRGQIQVDLGDSNAIFEKYWERLKLGG